MWENYESLFVNWTRFAVVPRQSCGWSSHLYFLPCMTGSLALISGIPLGSLVFPFWDMCVLSYRLTYSPVCSSPSLHTVSFFLSWCCSAECISEHRGVLSVPDNLVLAASFLVSFDSERRTGRERVHMELISHLNYWELFIGWGWEMEGLQSYQHDGLGLYPWSSGDGFKWRTGKN